MRVGRVLAVWLSAAAATATAVDALWPHPRRVASARQPLQINVESFRITTPPYAPPDLRRAATRVWSDIHRSSVQALVPDRGAARWSAVHAAPVLPSLDIHLPFNSSSLRDCVSRPLAQYDEAYNLTVPADGSPASIDARTALGALRGLATFQQLLLSLPQHRSHYVWDAPLRIEDAPAYPYRGLLLDTSRNFYGVSDLERTLDTMSFVKMNQFHWHIVDSQSFPLLLDGAYAILAQKGSPAGMRYTKEDVMHVVAYAADRGINVIVEIDMPGHAFAGPASFPGPSLLQCGGEADWWGIANEPPPGSLRLNDPAVNTYVSGLINEVAPLFPSAYFGTGGDEVNLNCYGARNTSDMDANGMFPFVQNAHAALEGLGKTPLVWEEMALDFPVTGRALRNGTLVEAWTTSANAARILASNPGVALVHAPSDFFYLDCGTAGDWLRGAQGNATSWCPYVSWSKTYEFDPQTGIRADDLAAGRVLGGEAALWSETADGAVLDATIWPRAAAAAEVFWTGGSFVRDSLGDRNGTGARGDGLRALARTRNVTEALPRLHDVRYRLVDRGVAARPLQPHYCALRPDACLAPPPSRA